MKNKSKRLLVATREPQTLANSSPWHEDMTNGCNFILYRNMYLYNKSIIRVYACESGPGANQARY